MSILPRVQWAAPGHEREYTVRFAEYGPENYIPRKFEASIRRGLPSGWDVCNRGSRLEIVPAAGYGVAEHEILRSALGDVLGEVEFLDLEPEAPRQTGGSPQLR